MDIKLIFMSIIVLGLIVNTSSFSDLAFADKPDKEEMKNEKMQRETKRAEDKAEREEIKQLRNGSVVTFSSTTSTEKADAKAEREAKRAEDKAEREALKQFRNDVVVTSFSTTTICHIPPGNPANAHLITIGSPAVRAHLDHGDSRDPVCKIDQEDYNAKHESKSSESSDKESNALERAQKLIEHLEQQISNLEDRLQNLLDKYESGEYYGNTSTADEITNSYVISFDGEATSIYVDSETAVMSGELVMENQVTTQDISKFKIVSGVVSVGDNDHTVAFGKARLSSSGPGGEENSLVIVMETIDSLDNDNTVKMTLGFDSPLEGELGDPSENFTILENSKVSGQWFLEGTGELHPKP
jgi:hypothetical protein